MRELAEFVPELANSKEYLCSKFDERLSVKIKEKMSVTSSQSYKKVVQFALRAKKLTSEKMYRGNFQKRKGFKFMSDKSSKKSRSSESFENSYGSETSSVSSPQCI